MCVCVYNEMYNDMEVTSGKSWTIMVLKALDHDHIGVHTGNSKDRKEIERNS